MRYFYTFVQNNDGVNLIIDQGNTTTKVALFHSSELKYYYVSQSECEDLQLDSLFSKYTVDACIFSSVADKSVYISLLEKLKKEIPAFLFFDSQTPLPIEIGYRTPKTLGCDRIAGVVGAMEAKPGENVLVIDAGTAITYDVLNSNGVFVGGNITTGMRTRFRALHDFTGKLPLVSDEGDIPLIGYDTETAIRSGVILGITYEMERYIEDLQKIYPDIFVFLTGGDTILFATKLKTPIFADKNLVLKGLNRILEYNVEK